LLKLNIGADGLKTGHTSEAGYGLVGSAKQGNRRVIFAFSGLQTAAERAEVSEQIVNWSFRQFSEATLAREGERVAEANVWMGKSSLVGLVPESDIDVLLPVLAKNKVKAEVIYNGPIEAPITKGQSLAELVLMPEDLPEMRIPLVAEADVPEGGFGIRLRTATGILMQQFGLNLAGAS
jgi:D-alanyl-D-alanine carboxypeptidase (penicillin-binding protein 5/6)